MSSWSIPAAVVPADGMIALRGRWERMAEERGEVVRLLPLGSGQVPSEESVGVAPALVAVVLAIPGVALGGIRFDWPQGASQTWPELGERHSFQPVWSDGREAVVVRIDDESGVAGEVVHVRGDGGLVVLGKDVVTWWQHLTRWAEHELEALNRDLRPQVAGDEDLRTLLQEAIDQDFLDWLRKSG